jgi:hypothetical protein
MDCQLNDFSWDLELLNKEALTRDPSIYRISVSMFGRITSNTISIESWNRYDLATEPGRQAIYIKKYDAMFFYHKNINMKYIEKFLKLILDNDEKLEEFFTKKNLDYFEIP